MLSACFAVYGRILNGFWADGKFELSETLIPRLLVVVVLPGYAVSRSVVPDENPAWLESLIKPCDGLFCIIPSEA